METIYEDQNDVIEEQKIMGNSQDEEAAVREAREWYDSDKAAKQFYTDEMKEDWKLFKGDHWNLLGSTGEELRTSEQQKNRPNSVENVTFSLVEGTASEFAQDVELVDFPVEEGDEQAAQVMSELKHFLLYKNRVTNERIKFLRWFFLYGTGIWHIHWDPDWKGGKGPNRWEGDIRWKALHPNCLVPDARCKEDINEGNRCHKVIWHPLETFEERYPDRYHLVQEQIMSTDDLLDDTAEDADGFTGSEYKNKQAPLVETWYVGKPLILGEGEQDLGTGLHIIKWAGEDQGIYLEHSNYIYFEPEETPSFPFIVKQCYQRENSIWGFGEAYFLKNPQIVLNKTSELILEGHMHSALGQTFYREQSVTKKQQKVIEKKGTLPGMWFAVKEPEGIKREYAQSVPASLQNEMGRLEKHMESLIGRFDVSQGKTPGGVTAFRAIAELTARAQVRLRIKESAITSSYEEAGQYINRLISQYYDEQRRYRIRGKDDQLSYKSFVMDDLLKFYDRETNQVIPYRQANQMGIPIDQFKEHLNAQGIPEENYEIYFPEFDTMCKVTSVVPSDRIYHMEIAKELLQANIIDIETFLQVMKTGRFPPVEEITRRMEQKKLAEQQAAMQQAIAARGVVPGQMPGQMPGQAGGQVPEEAQQGMIQLIQQLSPETRKRLAALPSDQFYAAMEKIMQEVGANGGNAGAVPQ